MFQYAMSKDIEQDNEYRIVRLLDYDWFIDPIEKHPFVDENGPIQFDPYMMPRCIDHDVSEGIIQYLTDNIFTKQCGSNTADRHRKCMQLSQSLSWFPGASSDKINKIVTVRSLIQLQNCTVHSYTHTNPLNKHYSAIILIQLHSTVVFESFISSMQCFFTHR